VRVVIGQDGGKEEREKKEGGKKNGAKMAQKGNWIAQKNRKKNNF